MCKSELYSKTINRIKKLLFTSIFYYKSSLNTTGHMHCSQRCV